MKTLISFVGDGAFSESVFENLAEEHNIRCDYIEISDIEQQLKKQLNTRIIVIVTSRLWPKMFRQILEFSFKKDKVAMFTTFHDTIQVFSPTFYMKESPCYLCYMKRELSLLDAPKQFRYEIIIREFFEKHPQEKVRGYLPSEARMAASVLKLRLERPKEYIGDCKKFSRLNSWTGNWKVFALHACNCRGPVDSNSSQLARQTTSIAPIINKLHIPK